jgi:hypothetical protein
VPPRAAQLDRKGSRPAPTHILVEGSPALAKTIRRYQKGMHVMAEPGFLDLRSDFRFAAGSREEILAHWQEDYKATVVNLRLNATVTKISGQSGNSVVQPP